MNKYDHIAGALQESVRSSEGDQVGKVYYEDEQVRLAIVHAREDIVLLVSHLSSANNQLKTIRRLMWAAVILLCVIAGHTQ